MNRGELKAMLARWAKKANVASIPFDDCVDMAYWRIVRETYPWQLDQEHIFDAESGTKVYGNVWAHTAPELAKLHSLYNNGRRLNPVLAQGLMERASQRPYENGPSSYCVVGSDIWVAPGVGGDLRGTYTKRDTDISGTNDEATNAGMDFMTDVYFQAALGYLCQWTEDSEEETKAWTRYGELRDKVNLDSARVRRGAGAGMAS